MDLPVSDALPNKIQRLGHLLGLLGSSNNEDVCFAMPGMLWALLQGEISHDTS